MKLKITIMALVLLVFAGIAAVYFFGFGEYLSFSDKNENVKLSPIENPVIGLNDEEAIENFDESYVLYLVASLGASSLHNVPLTDNTPKLEFYIDEEMFFAEIKDGAIFVGNGEIGNEDLLIRTSKAEAVKMIRNRDYIEDSFINGNSQFVLVSSKAELVAKGYLKLYNELKS